MLYVPHPSEGLNYSINEEKKRLVLHMMATNGAYKNDITIFLWTIICPTT